MANLKKWRVKEVDGRFYVQKKVWYGWSNYYRATPGGYDFFLTLYQAMESIKQLSKDRSTVYHYPERTGQPPPSPQRLGGYRPEAPTELVKTPPRQR